ncbi:BMP family ABC transporter substrate-binding protein [Bosea sp. BK604]|uniref:BMP family ABC transporter substrate-binding protein n=1 Tax=Bosea sp. BK604 TaxID=2512180 RepID=UPI001045AEF5|nr:BMP family ABC transporter substrate-binding protein [Bosea sp. BK604]TCR64965.1 nucleoside-binding protein [Bosea sp. BK604]
MTSIITRRRFNFGAGAAAAAAPLLGRSALAQSPLGVGFIYVGPIGDYGWSWTHDQGRKALDAHFGSKIKTSFIENVAEGPDAARALRQLAQANNQLIFATSFGFMNPTVQVAKQFPKLKFEHATGYQRADNLATYNARFYEGRAVIGTIAGHMSKSGKAGYIASFPIPEVVMGINAFTLAARKVNPNFTTKVIWASTWYDPAKEADAAKALIDQGCDVISQHTDSPAALQAAEQRGVFAFGQASDMRSFAPKAQLSAIVDDWSGYYVKRVQEAIDGSWKTGDVWGGIKDGFVKLAPYNDAVTPAARAAADAVKEGIVSGKLHPFTGELKDQKGTLRLKAGETAPDEMLAKMDWYVDGVQA